MKNISRNIFFWSLILLALMAAGVLFSPVSGDAPYYIATARDISRGFVPYQHINMAYTPIVMYLNSLIWTIFDEPGYFLFIVFQYAVILLSGFILYKIAIQSGLEKKKSIFTAVFFLICVLSCDGNYINLEVYNILFVLLAYLALQDQKFLLSGILLGITFFCKQYGLLNFIPFVLLVFFGEHQRIKNAFLLCLGGSLPLILFLVYFTGFKDVTIAELLYQLTGQGYGQKSLAGSKSFIGYLNGAKVLLLMLLPLVFLKFNPLRNKVQLVLFIGMLVSLLPVFVQNFQHYFLNAFPYAALLLILNWKTHHINWPVLHVSLAIVSLFLAIRLVNYTKKADNQRKVAEALEAIYPKGSPVYLKGTSNYLYILNDYANPALQRAGYSYIFKTDADFLKENTVLSFERIKNKVPERITTIDGTKIYEY